jgi:hypothetical protein
MEHLLVVCQKRNCRLSCSNVKWFASKPGLPLTYCTYELNQHIKVRTVGSRRMAASCLLDSDCNICSETREQPPSSRQVGAIHPLYLYSAMSDMSLPTSRCGRRASAPTSQES